MEEKRIRPTRSGLLAIELLIAVGVFTLCAAICVGLFVRSEVESADSADLMRAVNEARSVAECFKAAGGDFERTAQLCGGTAGPSAVTVVFDADWNLLSPRSSDMSEETYRINLAGHNENGYVRGELWVIKRDEPAELLTWDVAALTEASS
ncbi:MAG: hypothetical protein IJ705_07430 [Oscillospiraceae bacterium]|nr:hypothetical protein [Oscillospiraceae bacterium]